MHTYTPGSFSRYLGLNSAVTYDATRGRVLEKTSVSISQVRNISMALRPRNLSSGLLMLEEMNDKSPATPPEINVTNSQDLSQKN